jgi:hypothetical protein
MKKQTSSPLPFLLVVAVLSPLGCAGSGHSVVLRAGTALLHGGVVLVEPLRFDGARIEGVDFGAWRAAHGDREQAIFEQNRRLLSDTYRARVVDECERMGVRVVATPTVGALVVRTTVTELSPGFWASPAGEAEGRLRVDFVTEGAQDPIETIEVAVRRGARRKDPSSFDRVRALALGLGRETARYLASRVASPALASR